jgi:hypothetical protein
MSYVVRIFFYGARDSLEHENWIFSRENDSRDEKRGSQSVFSSPVGGRAGEIAPTEAATRGWGAFFRLSSFE